MEHFCQWEILGNTWFRMDQWEILGISDLLVILFPKYHFFPINRWRLSKNMTIDIYWLWINIGNYTRHLDTIFQNIHHHIRFPQPYKAPRSPRSPCPPRHRISMCCHSSCSVSRPWRCRSAKTSAWCSSSALVVFVAVLCLKKRKQLGGEHLQEIVRFLKYQWNEF